MSNDKSLLAKRAEETVAATRLFFQAITGEGRVAGKKLAVAAVRERGRDDLASVIDAEFEEEDEER
jgi:hypothetical protein